MKIKITSSADVSPAVTEVLGDDLTRAFISLYLPESGSEIDVRGLMRAASVTTFDRRNLKTMLGFQVDRSHGSAALALKFVNDHFIRTPRKGIIEISQSGGAAFTTWLVGGITRMKVLSLNASSVIAYEVAGGSLLSSNPA